MIWTKLAIGDFDRYVERSRSYLFHPAPDLPRRLKESGR
jgi:hypothetical protein